MSTSCSASDDVRPGSLVTPAASARDGVGRQALHRHCAGHGDHCNLQDRDLTRGRIYNDPDDHHDTYYYNNDDGSNIDNDHDHDHNHNDNHHRHHDHHRTSNDKSHGHPHDSQHESQEHQNQQHDGDQHPPQFQLDPQRSPFAAPLASYTPAPHSTNPASDAVALKRVSTLPLLEHFRPSDLATTNLLSPSWTSSFSAAVVPPTAAPAATSSSSSSSSSSPFPFLRSQSPQLSERDSIFATHYLPSDNDACTPQLRPRRDADDLDDSKVGLISSLEDVPASAVVSSASAPRRSGSSSTTGTAFTATTTGAGHHCGGDETTPLANAVAHHPTAFRAHVLRRLSDVLPKSPSGSLADSPGGWGRRQELRLGSNPSGSPSHSALKEAFRLQPKVVSEGPNPGSPTSNAPDRGPLPFARGDLVKPKAMVRPSFADHDRGITDPWGVVRHQKHGDPIDAMWESRLERSASRGRSARMEESIEANLTNVEPASNVRSRKSSHYLGLFKENTTSPDRKHREDFGGDEQDPQRSPASPPAPAPASPQSLPAPQKHHPLQHQHSQYRRLHRDPRPRASIHYPIPQYPGSHHEFSIFAPSVKDEPAKEVPQPVRYSEDASKGLPRSQRSLPRSLLEEIRNFHLGGPDPNGSLSRSAPTPFAERVPTGVLERKSSQECQSASLEATSAPRGLTSSLQDDEDDEEKEHISSALYFPHERASDEVETFPPLEDDPDRPQSSHTFAQGCMGLPDQEISHVDISLRSRHDSSILHGDFQTLQGPLSDPDDKSLATLSEYSSESDVASTDGSTLSTREEESSLTDEAELTPTATPTQRQRCFRPRRKHTSPSTIRAVELKPYRHQVGGHTTVFRFSRRAVCKQLNNRENEFYERIERRHPEMLMFLPRYIGVLNVTFSRNLKRPNGVMEHGNVKSLEGVKLSDRPARSLSAGAKDPQQPRVFSQQQVTGVIPKVILENNRHIIPVDLLPPHQRPWTTDGTGSSRRSVTNQDVAKQEAGTDGRTMRSNSRDIHARPPPLRHGNSWGATTVNRKLQEQVLREVFSPPAFNQHRRHGRNHPSLQRYSSDGIRRRLDPSEDPLTHRRSNNESHASPNGAAISYRNNGTDEVKSSPALSSSAVNTSSPLERVQAVTGSSLRANSLTGDRPLRRRHSGSRLQSRRSSVGGSTDLVLDDDGYGGDKEDEIFSMEHDGTRSTGPVAGKMTTTTTITTAAVSTTTTNGAAPKSPVSTRHGTPQGYSPSKRGIPASLQTSDLGTCVHLPINPKEAQTRKDERVQFFILLEDLTAGMNKPCVLDLKMGTRQYGLDADEKKKKSQRRKCQTTTSQQLGVRLCGMQTWNVKKQEYLFEDKYYGRDLKAGREFQDALTRFLYDGISYRSVAKKIPVILEKLGMLESMIRRLKRYRFYASSLLILYDGEQLAANGDTIQAGRAGGQLNSKQMPVEHPTPEDGHNNIDVQLKIVDFANCVTGEDELPSNVSCPPHHPDDVDRGYLRGLRTLRMYFQRILKEVNQEDYVERGEGEAMGVGPQGTNRESSSDRFWDEGVVESDPGEASF